MPSVQRKGDPNNKGGIILSGINSVLVNGRAIATVGQSVSPHPCCGQKGCPPIHCNARTSGGARSVKANGRAVSLTGNSDTCSDRRSGGSSNVKAS
jgi:uncharacterized Zn-binding protein involved in type VI secretion